MNAEQKQNILIVDDSELNRAILADMLDDEYTIIEAENGLQGVGLLQQMGTEISLVLLDIVLPQMDGFGVLEVMSQNHWIEDVPVIMISAETGSSHIERAYELGVTDFISRPFDALIVHRRVVNTTLTYATQNTLVDMVAGSFLQDKLNAGGLELEGLDFSTAVKSITEGDVSATFAGASDGVSSPEGRFLATLDGMVHPSEKILGAFRRLKW